MCHGTGLQFLSVLWVVGGGGGLSVFEADCAHLTPEHHVSVYLLCGSGCRHDWRCEWQVLLGVTLLY